MNNNNYSVKSEAELEEKANKQKLSLLERLIPVPKSFDGPCHPFKTCLERDDEIESERRKARLLEQYGVQFHSKYPDDVKNHTIAQEKQLQLNRHVIAKIRSKPGRKTAKEKAMLAEAEEMLKAQAKMAAATSSLAGKRKRGADGLVKNASKRKRSEVTAVVNGVVHDGINGSSRPTNGLSAHAYFGADRRIADGDRFAVLGRRVTTDGKTQYLIHWHGI